MSIAKVFGYNKYIELNALTIATIAIAVISATYSSEVLRASYLAISKGQIEAARALGMNKFSIFLITDIIIIILLFITNNHENFLLKSFYLNN